MSDESEAIKEVAITVGQVTNAAREIGGFIAKLIQGPLEQGIGIFEDKLRYIRLERQVRLRTRCKELMRGIGMTQPTRALPLNFAIPFFQGASLEEDDYLQDRWASLLVNAVNDQSGVDLKRSYIDILERINSLEARILEKIYSVPFETIQHVGVLTYDLPERIHVGNEQNNSSQNQKFPSPEVVIALVNLVHLDGIRFERAWGGGEIISKVNPTLLGFYFIKACTLKTGNSDIINNS